MGNMFTWKIHGDGKTLGPNDVVEPDERLTWGRTAGIGAQHVVAMFGATFFGADPDVFRSVDHIVLHSHVDCVVPVDQ
jgi:hypothetical protein